MSTTPRCAVVGEAEEGEGVEALAAEGTLPQRHLQLKVRAAIEGRRQQQRARDFRPREATLRPPALYPRRCVRERPRPLISREQVYSKRIVTPVRHLRAFVT